jgi:uncharacterized protein YktB (UPF0637 family)
VVIYRIQIENKSGNTSQFKRNVGENMTIPSFTISDFNLFQIDGLDARMNAIKSDIQPKFAAIGEEIATYLTSLLQDPVYVHIAKHARRTVNPPDETWVAWATNKRGYKAHPHFQLGLRHSHLFMWFALIYECDKKSSFAHHLKEQIDDFWKEIPSTFYISQDHTRPEITAIQNLNKEEFIHILDRLEKVKKAEFLIGTVLPREQAVQLTGAELIKKLENTFRTCYPLYKLSLL